MIPVRRRSDGWFRCSVRLAAAGFFLFCGARLRAADTGQFQLLLAAPDPVVAGEQVQFQVIAINQGTEIWRARRFYFQAEVYDANRKYVGQTERLRGMRDVNPGESAVSSLSFSFPVTASGKFYYRMYLVNEDQRIMESDFKPFTVRERAILLPRPPPVALGGNIVASYRNESGPNDYVGNLSVNMVGRYKDRSFLFNAYTISDRGDPIDFYTVLLNYYGPQVTAGLGDVSPAFSPLSLYGQGMRGGTAETKWQAGWLGGGITLVGARTATAEEGSSTTDGTFRRMLYGAKNEFYLPGRVTLRMNYVNTLDVQQSLDIPGPTLRPVDDRLAGGGLAWEAVPGLKFEGEYQSSSYEADKLSTAPAVTDGAWRGAVGWESDRMNFNGYVQRTGPDFVALGAPNATKDRFTYDAALSVSPFHWMSAYGSFNKYRDNLDDDPAVVTTHQQIVNSGLSFNLPSMTGLNFGYSVNTARGEPRTAQDNQTLTTSFGVSQTWIGQTLFVTYQTSDFEDKTQSSVAFSSGSKTNTDTYGTSLNLSFGSRVT
ncbi:MAG TPA: hypothetical protein P5079_07500, partial [Elusimicrobiota bacterium]|nr:hypothetical protein [Elusimicrobiota bacterium]